MVQIMTVHKFCVFHPSSRVKSRGEGGKAFPLKREGLVDGGHHGPKRGKRERGRMANSFEPSRHTGHWSSSSVGMTWTYSKQSDSSTFFASRFAFE